MDSLNMPRKVEPAELSILWIKECSKLYYGKQSIVDKISVYSWPENVAKQQHFGKNADAPPDFGDPKVALNNIYLPRVFHGAAVTGFYH